MRSCTAAPRILPRSGLRCYRSRARDAGGLSSRTWRARPTRRRHDEQPKGAARRRAAMRILRRCVIGFALALAILGTLGPGPSAQPQDESAAAMDARLAAARVARVGPTYLYPNPKLTPGM